MCKRDGRGNYVTSEGLGDQKPFFINCRLLDSFLEEKQYFIFFLPVQSAFFSCIIFYLLICFLDNSGYIFLISMTEVDLGPFPVLQEMCSAYVPLYFSGLLIRCDCRVAAIDLIVFIFRDYFLLFCLIFFSANSGICTLLQSSVALLVALVGSGEVCARAVPLPPIVGLVIFCEGGAWSREVPV